ncbi:MAG: amino acid ABC transporter substrate-binding protein [Clostridiales bacterium]|nr:amino acid ABC transporter substrate-binding protein [Clostridiales bacterium]
MKRFLGAAIASVMVFSAAGCGSVGGNTDGKEITKVVVGLDDTFAPMGYIDDSGELVGFDIDLANAVGELKGWEIEFKSIDWDTKAVELNTSMIDLIWNGFSYTEERNENRLLSEPYLDNAQIIIIPADSEIASKADLSGKTVGLQKESSAEDAIEADEIASEIGELVTYGTNIEAFTALEAGGTIDAVVADRVAAEYYIETSGADLRVLDDNFGSEVYVVAAKQGNSNLMDQIEEALTELGENGTAAEISEKWFGTNIYIH